MKKNFLLLLMTGAVLLAACGSPKVLANPTPVNTLSVSTPANAVSIDPSPEPDEQSAYSTYYNPQGDFSLALPPDWTTSPAETVSLGSQVILGPEPHDSASSTLIVADAAKVSVEQALQSLCAACSPLPELKKTTVNGLDAQTVEITSSPDAPPLEWFLLEKGSQRILFSLHNPDTFSTLDALVQSFSPGKGAGKGLAYHQAAWAAQQSYAADQGLDPYQVVVQHVEAVDWPDACLGAPSEGELCAQEMTPGYLGVLQSRDSMAEFHVNQAGSQIRLVPGAALTVRRAVAKQRSLDEKQIKIVKAEANEWQDTCLGLPTPGETCDPSSLPGFMVVLEIDGKRTEFHTDNSGSSYRKVP